MIGVENGQRHCHSSRAPRRREWASTVTATVSGPSTRRGLCAFRPLASGTRRERTCDPYPKHAPQLSLTLARIALLLSFRALSLVRVSLARRSFSHILDFSHTSPNKRAGHRCNARHRADVTSLDHSAPLLPWLHLPHRARWQGHIGKALLQIHPCGRRVRGVAQLGAPRHRIRIGQEEGDL
jgi:hypothetical protein